MVRTSSTPTPAITDNRASSDGRRGQLRELVRQSGFAALGELAQSLGVSESTIRRDLESLEQSGDLRRTHGGVFWAGETSTISAFEDRNDATWKAKAAIGAAAASLAQEHDTILIDVGSTAYELARNLGGRRLQVVTNSLPVAHLLSSSDSIDLITIGGHVRGRTGVAIGPLAELMISQINARLAFVSVAGITEEGYFNDNMMLVQSERKVLETADRTYVLADHTKFGKSSLSRIAGLGDVHGIVTDEGINSTWRQRLEDSGIEVIVAPKPPSE